MRSRPSRRRLSSAARSGSRDAGRNLVVTKISSRGIPLVRSATPTLSSLP